MKRTPLKYKSDKQKEKDALWNKITQEHAEELSFKCQWCHKEGHRDWYDGYPYTYLLGHHIRKRSRGRIDTKANNYICHWLCHSFIDQHNINVLKYPAKEFWERR